MYIHIIIRVCTYIINLTGNYMKIKRVLNRKDKNTEKEFYRWDITLDPELIKNLGWRKGTEIKSRVVGDKLVIERK